MAFAPALSTSRGPTVIKGHTGLQGQRVCPAAASQRRGRATISTRISASVVGDVGTYLADAAKQIFSPTKSNAPPNWSGTGSGFSGKVNHHEAARLRDLYVLLRQARVGIQGCMDPRAANYDPTATDDDGTCTIILEDGQEIKGKGPDLRNYVTNMLSSVWGNAVTNERSEGTFKGSGYPFSGDIVSRRDIERLIKYEKIVKKELEKAEEAEKVPAGSK